MGLLRFVLIGLLLFIVYLWLRSKWREFVRSFGPENPALITPQPLVACDHCGIRVPARDVVSDRQRTYCSKLCQDAAIQYHHS
ncbi:MAG: zinc finger MYND domain-containing protein [Magnetococcales bacterium]|nr:zinc finger MYND domain-containing protein [Magnetococcales bacterium]